MTSIAAGLERQRLVHRARRLERVLEALRNATATGGATQAHAPALEASIQDFARELVQVRLTLDQAPASTLARGSAATWSTGARP